MGRVFDGKHGGTVELLESVLVIRRKGVLSFLNQGLKGEKRIPYASIMSVQFKEVGLTTGYIQFGVLGGYESRGGVLAATQDENTVLFLKGAASQFRELRDIVEGKAAEARHGPVRHAPVALAVGEELTRLADLRDRGVLSDEEFSVQKAALLGSRPHETGIGTTGLGGANSTTEMTIGRGRDAQEKMSDKSGLRKALKIGCLTILAVFFAIVILGISLGETSKENVVSSNESN